MSNLIDTYKNKLRKKFYGQKKLPRPALRHLEVTEHINRSAPLEQNDYIIFDTELTGLNPKKDSIVSLGAVKMTGGRIDLSNTYYRVVEPLAALTGKSVVIHGITPSEASLCPKIDVLLPEFLDFCGSGIIVGHFVSIDLDFINKEMTRLFGFPLQNPAIDTHIIYKWIRRHEEKTCAFHAGLAEDLDLFSLATKYSIPVSEAHNALNDAFITAQVFQRFMSYLLQTGVKITEDLLRIGNPKKID